MWLSRLPDPQKINVSDEAPSFSENILFSEKLSYKYNYPEHTSSFGVIAVLEGEGLFRINGRQEKLSQEKFIIINSNSRLSINIAENHTKPALLYFKSHLPDVIASSLTKNHGQLLSDPGDNDHTIDFSILERLHTMDDGLRNKLLLLPDLGGSSSSFAALKADSIVRSILEDLVIKNNHAHLESANIVVKKRSTRIELYKRLYLAKDWIDANYNQPLTLDVLAGIACMNSQHFLRSFKQLFLFTPHQYLGRVRLQNARRMLLTTYDSIQTICRNTGSESLSSFSWLFKQKFGVAPSFFRKR
jgi:AraC-like DNA-binding protein